MTDIPRQVLWETHRRAEKLSRAITARVPPRVSDYILHGLERIDTFEELDLSVESWHTHEVQVEATLIEKSSSIRVSSSGPLPNERHSWNDLYVRALGNVSLDIDSGLVFTRDRVITQSTGGTRSARDSAFISGAAARYRMKTAIDIHATIAPVGDTWHHYHFLVETLPRLLHIKSIYPDVQYVGSQPMSPAAAECLQLVDINVRRVEKNEIVRASKVIICDSPTKFWPRMSDILAVRHAFLSKIATKCSDHSETSYISRLNSDRSPLGESDLEHELNKAGVRILHLENLSMLEQIDAVLRTTTVVGPHGAGLSAIMFMAPGQRIIELSSGNRFESCYRRMATLLDLNYEYIQLEGGPNSPDGAIDSMTISQILKSVT